MKKILLLTLVSMLCAVSTWAGPYVYKSVYANQQDLASQKQWESITHVNITSEKAGEIATMLNALMADGSTKLTTGSETFDASITQRLSITGPLNSDDLIALAKFFGSYEGLLSLKLENATISDEDWATFCKATDATFSNVNGLILPKTFKEITAETVANFTNAELAAAAFDTTEGSSFMTCYNKKAGNLYQALGISTNWTGKTFDKVTLNGNYGKKTITSFGNDGVVMADLNFLKANSASTDDKGATMTDLNLTNATFANYEGETLSGNTQSGYAYEEGTNGMVQIGSLFGSTLTQLELPTTVGTTLLPYQSLIGCNSISSLTIPANITTLGTECCMNMDALETVVAEGIEAVGIESFASCDKLTSVTLPTCCKVIKESAFNRCFGLKGIALPGGITEIKTQAFAYCEGLLAIRLPNSLQTIGSQAFLQCVSLQSITIPANVTSIASQAFAACVGLMHVYVLGTTTVPNCPWDAFDTYVQYNNNAVEKVTKGEWSTTPWQKGPDGSYSTDGWNPNTENFGCYRTKESTITLVDGTQQTYKTGAAMLHFPEGMGDIYSCETTRNQYYRGTFEASGTEDWTNDDFGITKWATDGDLYVYWSALGLVNNMPAALNSDEVKAFGYGDWTDSKINGGATTNTDGFKLFILTKQSTKEDVYEFPNIKKDRWYTICVPFDITANQLEETFGNGYEVAQFNEVKYEGNKLYLNFTNTISNGKSGSDVVIEKHVPYMIHPHSMAVDAKGNPTETTFTITGIKIADEDYNMSAEDMQNYKVEVKEPDGTRMFTFIGLGHNNIYTKDANDKTKGIGKRVLLPWNCYFFGTASGATWPKFYRESAKDDSDRGTGLWTNNTAIVLAPGWTYEEPKTYIAQSDDYEATEDGVITAGYQTWKSGYTMDAYVYAGKTATSAKALSSFEFVVNNDPLKDHSGETTGIKTVTTTESNMPARLQGKVFNINGQYVGTSLNGLSKGIYLVNGKKYVVK